eukprot:TRINITY_DN55600_c0_g2_i1.p1 TRINITY_DN55600_c0_g2~~TRINITY_DN55600_c0_g2_i1.p1  ORF type:complete len:424 (-),score=42.70 TRINITY_DN55600_c0_g2_i1:182-1453(-)
MSRQEGGLRGDGGKSHVASTEAQWQEWHKDSSCGYAADLLGFERMGRRNAWDDQEHLRQERLINNALYRMQHLHLSRGLNTLRAKAREMKGQKFLVAGSIQRMINRLLSMAWEKWQQDCAVRHAQWQLLDSAARKFRNAKVVAAWNQWRSCAEELRRQQSKLRGALTRMKNLQLSRAWEKWQASAAALKHEARLLGGALHRIWNRHLSRAWEKWQQDADEARRQASLLRRGLMRLMKRKLAIAFARWEDFVDEIARSRDRIQAATGRWCHQQLFAGWNTWTVAVKNPKQQQGMVPSLLQSPCLDTGPKYTLFSWSKQNVIKSRVPTGPVRLYRTSTASDRYGRDPNGQPRQPFQSPKRRPYDRDMDNPVFHGAVPDIANGDRCMLSEVEGVIGIGVVRERPTGDGIFRASVSLQANFSPSRHR